MSWTWGSHSSGYKQYFRMACDTEYDALEKHTASIIEVKESQASRMGPFVACFLLVSCLAYSPTLKIEAICSSKPLWFSSRLHDITSQKKVLFKENGPPATWGRDSSVTIATGYKPVSQETGSIPGMAKEFFSSPQYPDQCSFYPMRTRG
jgi:hypothetical protein